MQVDPAVLDTAAQQSHDLAGRWTSASAAVEPDTHAATAALGAGFALRGALEQVLSGHLADAKQHADHLRAFGDALSASAGDYRTGDTSVSNRFFSLKAP